MIRAVLIASLLLPALFAEDHPAGRVKASDYPAHTSTQRLAIGAEYLLHSIPAENGFVFARDYLVIEVALFPAQGESLRTSPEQFTLSINHGKSLVTDSAGTVAGSIKYPDWEQHPTTMVQAGPLILGGPSGVGRFPGDPTQDKPIPRPAGDPTADSSGMDQVPPADIDETVARASLASGPIEKSAHGCLFFKYRKNTNKIRSLELIYDPGEGRPKTTIPLL